MPSWLTILGFGLLWAGEMAIAYAVIPTLTSVQHCTVAAAHEVVRSREANENLDKVFEAAKHAAESTEWFKGAVQNDLDVYRGRVDRLEALIDSLVNAHDDTLLLVPPRHAA